jgi:hypothetical protein
VAQSLADVERLVPACQRLRAFFLSGMQVAESFKRARNANPVAVTTRQDKRTFVMCNCNLRLTQCACGIAKMDERNALTARILRQLLQFTGALVRLHRLLVTPKPAQHRANNGIRARLTDNIVDPPT